MPPKKLLYLIVWPNGHEEKIYADNWKELVHIIEEHSMLLNGLPDLIYRKE